MSSDIAVEQAKAIAQQYIHKGNPQNDAIIVDRFTREEPYGWVFFYDSKEYVETGNRHAKLFGNAPLIVTKKGEVHVTGTAHPIAHYLKEFESK